MDKRTPILLVIGFLGSGKTTFLNWLIRTHPKLKISLILNEFGDVKLESQFIKKRSGEITELANGCMCCVAKSDVPRVINLILEKSPETEYIVIEASGLSDPDPIRGVLQSPGLSEEIRLESTVCIVDVINFERTYEGHPIVMSQVGDADLVMLSKIKEAGEETTARVKKIIEGIGIETKIILWDDDLNPDLFVNPENSQIRVREEVKTEDHGHHHEHERYDEFWFKSDKQIDLVKFTRVMNDLPANIVRSKGYVNSRGEKIMVQYVPNKLETYKSEWKNESPNTAVLFLGKELDIDSLKQKLVMCEVNQLSV